MKKFLSIVLALTFVLCAFAGCNAGKPEETTANEETKAPENNDAPKTLKFGMGFAAEYGAPVDADGDVNGSCKVSATVAAVLVDADGKIVSATVDAMDVTAEWTSEGAAVPASEIKTKRELGDAYNMVMYGQAKAEWYAQADNFCKLIKGKTANEVMLLVSEGNKGTDEVVNAGCTIMIKDFAVAIERAVSNAKDSDATADATLAIGMYADASTVDADADVAGEYGVDIYATAVAKKDGKVVASKSDCAPAKVGFNADGTATGTTPGIQTKGEQGDNYNMVMYGNAKAEWYKQAEAFDAACKGKTAAEIEKLVAADGKGVESLQSANCTIYVTGFVKTAVKAAK